MKGEEDRSKVHETEHVRPIGGGGGKTIRRGRERKNELEKKVEGRVGESLTLFEFEVKGT